MNGSSGAGLQAQELSDWTLAVLEKVQSGDPLHISDARLVHPQERLRPLRLWLIVSAALHVVAPVWQQEGHRLKLTRTIAHRLRVVLAARHHHEIMRGNRNRRTCNELLDLLWRVEVSVKVIVVHWAGDHVNTVILRCIFDQQNLLKILPKSLELWEDRHHVSKCQSIKLIFR